MLKLMYITKSPAVARIAEEAGVDRIFVDLEKIGKELRQGGMNTVKSDHTVSDVAAVREVLTKARLLVRVNPIHDGSREEIRAVLSAGADLLMLPYFSTKEEVCRFSEWVGGKAARMLLVETVGASSRLDEILADGLGDLVHVGINDLHLQMKKKFMFELLADGTVESIGKICKKHQIPFGFGGVASLGGGRLPAELVLAEHYRQGSDAVILSRSFCDLSQIEDMGKVREIFLSGVAAIREYERFLQKQPPGFFAQAHQKMAARIAEITEGEA